MREDVSFYETSAQVIPLLLLAATLETAFLKNLRPFANAAERARHATRDAIMLPIAVALVLAGESVALFASLVGHAGPWAEFVTGVALLIGFWGVFTPIVNDVIAATTKLLADNDITDYRRDRAMAAGKWSSMAIHGAIYAMVGLLAVRLVVHLLG